jgi:hypothetical protein
VKSAAALSRRSLLGLIVLAVAGCKHGSSRTAAQAAGAADALASARASELSLLTAYGNARDLGLSGAEAARIEAERALHVAHFHALGGASEPLATGASAAATSIRTQLRTSAATLRAAAVVAVDGADAALLASIAASHEAAGRG